MFVPIASFVRSKFNDIRAVRVFFFRNMKFIMILMNVPWTVTVPTKHEIAGQKPFAILY